MKSTLPNDLVRCMDLKTISFLLVTFGLIGPFTIPASAQAGAFDDSFQGGVGPDEDVGHILVLPDDRLLIGGPFTTYNGVNRNGLVRTDENGVLDNGFSIGSGLLRNDEYLPGVFTIKRSGLGGYYIGGRFDTYNGVPRNGIVRIHNDGLLDPAFDPGTGVLGNNVDDIAVQMGNSILVGGSFGTYNGQTAHGLCRVLPDGSLDATFVSLFHSSAVVDGIHVDANNYAYVGGDFGSFDGQPAHKIVKLLPNGGLDPNFQNANTCNGWVDKILPSGDGNFYLIGNFTEYDGFEANKVAKINSQGSLIHAYNVGSGPDYYFYDAVVQGDGKIILVGNFTTFNGQPAPHIVRLMQDGSVDPEFMAGSGSNYTIHACALQSDGKIIIGGYFTDYNGNAAAGIARLHNDFTSSIAGSQADSPFRIHPNPATGSCSIIGNRSNRPLKVTLSDVHGRVVRSMTTYKHIDTSDLPSGLYVVQIAEGEDLSTVKLLVD